MDITFKGHHTDVQERFRGYAAAKLRNRALAAYGSLLKRRAAAELRSRGLDEV